MSLMHLFPKSPYRTMTELALPNVDTQGTQPMRIAISVNSHLRQ